MPGRRAARHAVGDSADAAVSAPCSARADASTARDRGSNAAAMRSRNPIVRVRDARQSERRAPCGSARWRRPPAVLRVARPCSPCLAGVVDVLRPRRDRRRGPVLHAARGRTAVRRDLVAAGRAARPVSAAAERRLPRGVHGRRRTDDRQDAGAHPGRRRSSPATSAWRSGRHPRRRGAARDRVSRVAAAGRSRLCSDPLRPRWTRACTIVWPTRAS